MNYEYSNRSHQNLKLDSFQEQLQLGLQICGQLLVESKHVILGALAWKGWIEQGRCLVVVNLPNPSEFSQAIDLPMGIMPQNDSQVQLLGATELVRDYNPECEGVLVVCHSNETYCMAAACIFNPGYPPHICYEEVKNRPAEFDFNWVDEQSFDFTF